LWEHGVMMDLNDLVSDDYTDQLFTANDINNLGQITGFAFHAGSEDAIPVWALPLDKRGHRGAADDSREARNTAQRLPLPPRVRQQVLARAFATEAQLGR
jgi:hypothetical protein